MVSRVWSSVSLGEWLGSFCVQGHSHHSHQSQKCRGSVTAPPQPFPTHLFEALIEIKILYKVLKTKW